MTMVRSLDHSMACAAASFNVAVSAEDCRSQSVIVAVIRMSDSQPHNWPIRASGATERGRVRLHRITYRSVYCDAILQALESRSYHRFSYSHDG
jgi:hypothetical protein